jgi:Domain of unknown function (DUF3854)
MTTNSNPIEDRHAQEFADSAIAEDIATLNFHSFNGENENELDEAFTLLIEEPDHNNNGTLAGKSPNDLANALRSGGWIFEGYKGVCVKPNSPRKVKDENGKEKDIKYESPRGQGKLQLFIPRISWEIGRKLLAKTGSVSEVRYLERMDENANPSDEDCGFWDWVLETNIPIIITEGAKKACSLVSNGYTAIGLNGIWGWGTNIKDEYGNVEKDNCGKSLKTIHPDLEPFLDGREIVLAFDREATSDKVKTVEMAKAAFARAVEIDEMALTDLKWKSPKGIDDYITVKGVKALDRLYANRKEFKPPEPPKPERVTSGDTLLEIGKTATYFHTADKVPYADIWIEGNRHTYAVRSKAFRMWLSGEFYKSEGKGIGSQTLQDTLNTLEAISLFEGETREVHLRTADHQGKIYLDLGTPDWKAIEIDAVGWRLVSDYPVRFWRPESQLPLPIPVTGGNLDELKDLLNVDGSAWTLIVTFLLFCFCPYKTYTVLVISAHRGSGKTAAAEIIKGLIDPGKAPLIKLQNDTHKLAVAAIRRLLLVYDNVGHINPDQSDDLCRVATGFGYSTRTLHETDGETTFEFTRPQIITAIDNLLINIMNHNETEIPIIGGYDRLEYTIDGGWMVQIPSQKLLEELIRFPKIDKRYPDPSDPFNVDYYRIRDRDEDLDNQLLLQSRSNWIIGKIDESRYHPSEFESKLWSSCDKHHFCFQSVYYRLKLMQYCRNIMPGVYPDTSIKNPALIRAFDRMKDLSEDGYSKRYDLTKPLVNNLAVASYQKRSVLFYETLRRRFYEYNEAFQYMDWLISIPCIYEEMRDVIYEDMFIQNKKNENIRYQRHHGDKQSINKKSTNNTDSQTADAEKILTQCVFCNRFQLQKPNQRGLKRYCIDRAECKKKDRAWRGSLISRNISLENDDVSPSSF